MLIFFVKISESIGRVDPANPEKQIGVLTISDLCRSISALYARANLSFTPQLCARVAFLVCCTTLSQANSLVETISVSALYTSF